LTAQPDDEGAAVTDQQTPTYTAPEPEKKKRSGSFILRIVVIVVAALVVSAVVFGVSQAAFSDSTSVRGNVSTGTVNLENNSESSTLFALSGLTGGDVFTTCVHVVYNGSITPAPVVLYGLDEDASGGLGQYLDLVVEVGSGKSSVAPGDTSCTGFTAEDTLFGDSAATFKDFTDAHDSFDDGLDTGWTAAAEGEAKDFRFTFTVQDTNDAQNKSSRPAFTWETRP
jgi:hypothetical protein